jgi:hypothetical protein
MPVAVEVNAQCDPSGLITINDNRIIRSYGNGGISASMHGHLTVSVSRNLIQNGFRGIYAVDGGIFGVAASSILLQNNTIVGNQQGAWVGTDPGGTLTLIGNALATNVEEDLANIWRSNVNASNNWWGRRIAC